MIETVGNLGADIRIKQIFRILHRLRRSAHVHQNHRRARSGNNGRHLRIEGHGADVVDDVSSRLQSRRRNGGLPCIDADDGIASNLLQGTDHGNEPLDLDRDGNFFRSGTRGFGSGVDAAGPRIKHCKCAAHGPIRIQEMPSVAEGVRRHVQDAEKRRNPVRAIFQSAVIPQFQAFHRHRSHRLP